MLLEKRRNAFAAEETVPTRGPNDKNILGNSSHNIYSLV